MLIESRLKRIEDTIGAAAAPKTMEDMLRAFYRGDYGGSTPMSIVAGALSASSREAFFESLGRKMPAMLVDHFKSVLSRTEKSHNPIAG